MISIGLQRSSLVRKVSRMASTNTSYELAIHKLNSLQSNKSTIEQIKRNLKTGQKCINIEDMEDFLARIGIPLTKLDELSVIHVAGTKGKGSTSAMCESILRHHGYRTGFYSSPHLVAACERIRLDGAPLSKDHFARYLHHVYGLLENTQEFPGDMPKYFAFLTVMAFYVFLQEKVDVAIVEVGIGGIVDYTNVLRKVPVVGITALGLDHTSILGHTLPAIAAAKAGVMKAGCEAYTVPQPLEAMDVLSAYAGAVKCPLTVAPDYASYRFPETNFHLPIDLDAYRTNASLAVQLSHTWMRTHKRNKLNGFKNKGQNGLTNISNGHAYMQHNGLTNVNACKQNGLAKGMAQGQNGSTDINAQEQNGLINRNGPKQNSFADEKSQDQYINGNGLRQNSSTNGNAQEVNGLYDTDIDNCLTYNVSSKLVYEIPHETMEGLAKCKWPGRYQVVPTEYATFYLDGAHTKESMEICAKWFTDSSDRSIDKILIFSATGDRNAEILLQPLLNVPFKQVFFVIPTAYRVTTSNNDNYSLVEQEELILRCQKHAEIWQKTNKNNITTVLECVSDALESVKTEGVKPTVLITGSLHLVGAALSILDPNLST